MPILELKLRYCDVAVSGLYVPHHGESINSIVHKLSKKLPYLTAEEIINDNRAHLPGMGLREPYDPNQIIPKAGYALCVPSPKIKHNPIRNRLHQEVRSANRMSLQARHKIKQMINDGHDLNVVKHVAMMTAAMKNTQNQTQTFGASAIAFSAFDQAIDYFKERSESLVDKIANIEDTLKIYLSTPLGKRSTIRSQLVTSMQELNQEFNRSLSGLEKIHVKDSNSKIFRKASNMVQSAKSSSYYLSDTASFKTLESAAKTVKIVSRGLVAYELFKIGLETYDVYKEDGRWIKELIKDLSGFGTGYGAAYITMSFLTGALGWYVIIPAAIIGLAVDEGTEHYIEKFL